MMRTIVNYSLCFLLLSNILGYKSYQTFWSYIIFVYTHYINFHWVDFIL